MRTKRSWKESATAFTEFKARSGTYDFCVDKAGNVRGSSGTVMLTAKQAVRVLEDREKYLPLFIQVEEERQRFKVLRGILSKAELVLNKARKEYDEAVKQVSEFKFESRDTLRATKLQRTRIYGIHHDKDSVHVGCNRVPIAIVKKVVALCIKRAGLKGVKK